MELIRKNAQSKEVSTYNLDMVDWFALELAVFKISATYQITFVKLYSVFLAPETKCK